MARYKKTDTYNREELQTHANNAISIAGFLRNLKIGHIAGGNYGTAKKLLQIYQINTDHWKLQGWSKGEQLKNWAEYTNLTAIKRNLLKLRGHYCENCKLATWLEQLIPLEVHHINGDRTNNSLENLQLLCCNCHALTKNWRGRNISKSEKREKYQRPKKKQCLLCQKSCAKQYCSRECVVKKRKRARDEKAAIGHLPVI